VQEEILEGGERTGVELEPEDELLQITRPFDPEKIKVSKAAKTISLLITQIDEDEIDLAPEFQRRARIWDIGRKSRLIESLLLRIPLPVFYVAADADENWSVVDGLQRLTTIHDFVKDAFKLSGLEYLTQFEGSCYDSLPRNMKRRIEETELVINVIEPGTPEEVMFNIFKRINTGGVTLNGQEIRHALNKGPVREFLNTLARSGEFQEATDGSVSDTRMAAQECALRFLAFQLTPWEAYEANDLDGFLNTAMRRLNEMPENERNRLCDEFMRAMHAAARNFGKDAFRKRYSLEAGRNPISKALLEAWAVNLAARDDWELRLLVDKKENLRVSFVELMNIDRFFEASISYSTGVPQRVKKRFSAVNAIIEGTLSGPLRL
jgi:hypothetical protein